VIFRDSAGAFVKNFSERGEATSQILTDASPKLSTSFYHVPQIQRYYNKIDQIIKKNMNFKNETKNQKKNASQDFRVVY
jgi:hypothetical protein